MHMPVKPRLRLWCNSSVIATLRILDVSEGSLRLQKSGHDVSIPIMYYPSQSKSDTHRRLTFRWIFIYSFIYFYFYFYSDSHGLLRIGRSIVTR